MTATTRSDPRTEWPRIARAKVGAVCGPDTLWAARHYLNCARLLLALSVDDFDLLDQLDAELDRKAAWLGVVDGEIVLEAG